MLLKKIELLRPIPKYTADLPILERREEIVSALNSNQVIIVAGETGSGKTTQLPVMCLEAGRGKLGKIGCTQPRRIAATSIAARVAQELDCTLGREVGYKIRFNAIDTAQTSITFMTDGILLTEIERDPLLKMYDTLIIDEAHERSLNIDFILGFLRNLLPLRPDLKLIISSATIDTELFSKSFGNAPVIEVSGRMFPVEVLYLDPVVEEDGECEDDVDYVDAAVRAVRDMSDMYGSGDMLIFMPTERDIREVCDKLNGMRFGNTVILPLFARLSKGEQEQIFKPLNCRKIVVATNIAETSITVPGIQFVIDTGLARTSRYIPRLRTNRLPVEPISQAAAQQRMGRCGRVMDGICVRLYSEKEFLTREQFTLPEIKRANLAGVVLSMVAHRLGNIEEFPFLEPPSKQAISEAYAQLRELGAIDNQNSLTAMGREMAALPLDPHIARMVIAAKKEHTLREIRIIASALSIVDPRERPFDKQAEADLMHKKFSDPASDFLMYVNLWDAYQQEWQTLRTQGKMRKFCKEHFLSYVRMQEWHDVYQQLLGTLATMPGFKENTQKASYDAIHRSLLSGLLTNCAVKSENGRYQAARGREVLIFPGSIIAGKGAEWVMCHEVVETSQVFARTVAVVKPEWLEEIGAHLCSKSYSEPYFDEELGMVKADEQVTLLGLPVAKHLGIRYGRINPIKATEVFIWKGLVEEALVCHHPFYIHNKKLRKEIEKMEAKLRTRSLFAGEQAIADFYNGKLLNVSSNHDLNKFIKELKNDKVLFMAQEDLLAQEIPEYSRKAPDVVTIGGKKFPLKYQFAPGADDDGVTLRISQRDASFIPGSSLGWLLPHLWPEYISELLQNLPKDLRKKLIPLSEKTAEIASVLKIEQESFHVSVAKALQILYGISIEPDLLVNKKLSPHLSLRVEVYDEKGKVIVSGRDESVLSSHNLANDTFIDSSWERDFQSFGRKSLKKWDFGDLADKQEVVSSQNSIPLYGYPALSPDNESVNLIMAKSAQEAERIHRNGVRLLTEITIASEFIWIERELRFTQQLKLQTTPFGGAEKIKTMLLHIIKNHLLETPSPLPRKQAEFELILAKIHKESAGIGYEALSLLEKVMQLYIDNQDRISKESRPRLHELKLHLKNELLLYVNRLFDGSVTFSTFRQYPRYLKAFGYRIERAYNEPLKYGEKRAILEYYLKNLTVLKSKKGGNANTDSESFYLMVEEFAISLFAQQEVKTLFPVSVQRLDKKWEEIKRCLGQVK